LVGFGSSFWALKIHFVFLDEVHEGLTFPFFMIIKQNFDLGNLHLCDPSTQTTFDYGYFVANDLFPHQQTHLQVSFDDVHYLLKQQLLY